MDKEKKEDMKYDVIIIGGGCAGFPAATYTKRYNLSTLVISKEIGGLINQAHLVENFPGFKSIPGFELGLKLKEQAEFNGVEIITDSVYQVQKRGNSFIVKTQNEKTFITKALILATGAKHRVLNIEREKEFLGKGISYCATCDNMFYKNKIVGVVGGSDSAFMDAGILAEQSKKVYLFVRSEIRAEPINVKHLQKFDNVEIIKGVTVKSLQGDEFLNGVVLSNEQQITLDGLFVAIGSIPSSEEIASMLDIQLNKRKEIIVDTECQTNVSGVFACGDVTNNGWKQAVVAAYQGSKAGLSAYKYLKSYK